MVHAILHLLRSICELHMASIQIRDVVESNKVLRGFVWVKS